MKENIQTRENDGFEVVLLGVKDESNKVLAASLFSKIPTMGSYVYYSNRGPVMDYSDLGLVDFTYANQKSIYINTNVYTLKLIHTGFIKFMIKILIHLKIERKMMLQLICLNHMDMNTMDLLLNMTHQVKQDGWVLAI